MAPMSSEPPKPASRLFGRDIVVPAASVNERVSFLVWGKSGCGKTALAGTMPGRILWIGFDPDGEKTVAGREHIDFVNMVTMSPDQVPMFLEGEAYERGLDDYLKANKPASVVIDSITSFAQLALTHAITSGKASGRGFKATMDVPGMSGYGVRNRTVLSFIRMVLRVTAKHNTHVMLICHEDAPDKKPDDKGQMQEVKLSMLLGGTLPEEVPIQISEVWYMSDALGRRTIYLRPFGIVVPMRTRMFRTDKRSSFVWDYNMYDDTGKKVSDYINDWRNGGPGYKLPLT